MCHENPAEPAPCKVCENDSSAAYADYFRHMSERHDSRADALMVAAGLGPPSCGGVGYFSVGPHSPVREDPRIAEGWIAAVRSQTSELEDARRAYGVAPKPEPLYRIVYVTGIVGRPRVWSFTLAAVTDAIAHARESASVTWIPVAVERVPHT